MIGGLFVFIFGPFVVASICIAFRIRRRKLQDLQRERAYLKRVDKNTWPS
jgi:hypothetical protein